MAAVMERSRPRVPYSPEKSDRVVIHIPKALSKAVTAYQRRKLIANRSEALRRLVQIGLETEQTREAKAKE